MIGIAQIPALGKGRPISEARKQKVQWNVGDARENLSDDTECMEGSAGRTKGETVLRL